MFGRNLLTKNKILNNYLFKNYSKEIPAIRIQETSFERPAEKKPQRESFFKALVTGNIDKEILTFPEERSNRFNDFYNWLTPIENYMSNVIDKNIDKNEILNQLRELEVFRSHIKEQNFGLNLTKTESLKLIEVLSNLPWLGTYIVKNYILPVQIISKYGSNDQNIKYCSKIMSGEMLPTICLHEGYHGSNINCITSCAIPTERDSWSLNGEKTHVINGINSNLFLVFTRNMLPSVNNNGPDTFSLFLVERDFGGITCTDVHETIGKHETPTCTINFQNTIIPSENIIAKGKDAFKILMECLKPGQQNVSAQAISILRNLIKQLIPDILELKNFDRELYQLDVTKKIVGEIIFSLYTMESMVYLTSGMIDRYENIDAEIEQIITETYCANNCLNCVQKAMKLIGAQSYLNNQSYIQALHDALALTTIDTNNIDASTYIAACMLQHMGNHVKEHVHKRRNIFQYPFYNIVESLLSKLKIKLVTQDYFHPSFSYGVIHLENSINTFKESILTLLEENGSQILEQYINMQRIAEMLTEIYATFATLSRASRSYSIGVRNAEDERVMAIKMSIVSYHKVSSIATSIEEQVSDRDDSSCKTMAELAYEKRKYPMEHPLTRMC